MSNNANIIEYFRGFKSNYSPFFFALESVIDLSSGPGTIWLFGPGTKLSYLGRNYLGCGGGGYEWGKMTSDHYKMQKNTTEMCFNINSNISDNMINTYWLT